MTVSRPPDVTCDQCGKIEPMLSFGSSWGAAWQLPVGWVRIEQSGVTGGTTTLPPEVDAVAAGKTFCSVDHAAKGLAEAMPAH